MTTRKPFATSAERARKTLLGVEIPRDELACRIGEAATGMKRPPGISPEQALAQMASVSADTVAGFYRAADVAVFYLHERINAARQPS